MITTAALPARRLIIAGGFVLAAMAPMAALAGAAPSSHVAACPNGEDNDFYTGACVPYLVPNSPAAPKSAPQPAANTCPPGVTGAECEGSTGNASQPQLIAPQGPEQSLQDVSTPDY